MNDDTIFENFLETWKLYSYMTYGQFVNFIKSVAVDDDTTANSLSNFAYDDWNYIFTKLKLGCEVNY